MYTQCPKCLTYFQVTAEHLKVAQGNVRCGQCSNVFSALGNLSEMPPRGAEKKAAADSETTPSRKRTPTPKSAPATPNAAQSKLSSAIAAIQALNQSSQRILSQGRKNYVAQLQRHAQSNRKYTRIDGDSSTARNLNQEEPEIHIEDPQNNAADQVEHEIDFEKALAAVDDIDIDEFDDLEEDSPIQYGISDDEDITPAIDGSHLVADYNVVEPEPETQETAKRRQPQQSAGTSPPVNDDDFNFSELNLPATKDNDSKEARKQQSKPPRQKQKSQRKKTVRKKKPAPKRAENAGHQATATAARHVVSDPDVVIENNIPTLAIPKQLLEDFQQEQHIHPAQYRSMITWGISSLIMMLIFLGQAIYFKHNELGQVSQLRPYIEMFCRHASCELSMQADIGQIELLGQDIRSHPKNKKALLVSATIINNAPFTQPYPGLRLSFSDMNGEKVAMRNFLPNDYLSKSMNLNKGMESNVPIQIELEIVDPGKNAVNFEFDFFSI